MASEHLSLPGSSNMVALSYRGTEPDVRHARLVREKQSRETADRMERFQSRDMDASAWADAHRAKIRGRNGAVRSRGTTAEHPIIEEVRQAARGQMGQAVSDWLKETEPEQEQEPEAPQTQSRRTQRGDNENTLRPVLLSARGNHGQLGRRNSRGARYQHVGQRGVPQRKRLPPNSLHRLLPEDWRQGKRQRAINRYKKDLRGTPAAPLQRAAWKTTIHQEQARHRGAQHH